MENTSEKLQIIYKNVSSLRPYKNNPRKNDVAVEYVARSIQEFGFKNPIILGKDDEIVCGHTRLKAAIQLGLAEVPCIYVKGQLAKKGYHVDVDEIEAAVHELTVISG